MIADHTDPPPITTTGVRHIYASPWWRVEEHFVVDVDGHPGLYNVLRCGDGVTVLATTGTDYYLIREYKYAIGAHLLQLASGSVDPGETPLQAARRELLEETGLTSGSWTLLGIVHPYPTNVAATVYLFRAADVRLTSVPEPGVDLHRLPATEVRALVAAGGITHAASLVCLLTHLHASMP